MPFKVPMPDTQVSFYEKLERLKKTHLQEALLETVRGSSITEIDRQLSELVDQEDLQAIAAQGLRGEIAFPVPYILEQAPYLLAYYRLLLGLPQKSFYGGMGFGIFKSMEVKGTLSIEQKAQLRDCCAVLIKSASILINAIENGTIDRDLFRDLTLLTLGAQLRGGRNNDLGTAATRIIFNMIRDIVQKSIVKSTPSEITLKNAAKREIIIKFAADPDIVILERLKSGIYQNKIAIEIKGGTDTANAHNRLGEAEKSHQKAKNTGFTEFWTLVGSRIDLEKAEKESPTTTMFFYIPDLSDPESEEYQRFRDHLIAMVGIED